MSEGKIRQKKRRKVHRSILVILQNLINDQARINENAKEEKILVIFQVIKKIKI